GSAKELNSKINFWIMPQALGSKLLGLMVIIILIWLGVKIAKRKSQYLVLFILFSLVLASPALAITSSTSGTTTVSGTYTKSGGGCTGCGGGGTGDTGGTGGDTTAPSAVTNLLVDATTDTTATLAWTAPGDDNNSGTASQYDIRYSLGTITADNWVNATSINNEPTPQVVNTSQSVIISNLNPNTPYYFALKTADEKPNWSNLSNVASATTLPASQPPTDTTAPEISQITVKPGINSAVINWLTNESADSQVAYGVTNKLGSLKTSASFVTSHAIFLSNLSADTLYYFKVISVDASGNQAIGLYGGEVIGTFKTLPEEAAPPSPTPPPPVGGSTSQCSDGADNDGDGYKDFPNDLGCVNSQDNDETEVVGESVPVGTGGEQVPGGSGGAGGTIQELQLSDFVFTVAKGQIIVPNNFNISTLAGAGLQVSLFQTKLPKSIDSIILNVAGSSYLFSLQNGKWQTEISTPAQVGIYQAVFLVNFTDQTKNIVSWQMESKPYGQIYEKVSGQKKILAGAVVSLFQNGKLWPANDFYQSNPQITVEDGLFGFLVPMGNYLLQIEKENYSTEKINLISDGIIVHPSVELLFVPPALKDVIDLSASLAENAQNIAKNLEEKAIFAGKKIGKEIGQSAQKVISEAGKIISNPENQKTVEQAAAPAVAGAAAAAATASVGWASLLNYLRFLFTQPALLFKRRKRKNWGVIYNSLTKLPLKLMTVRLIDAESGRIVQSRVTDGEGRYAFFPAEGSYKLEISADQFDFPSRFFSELHEDGQFVDLYHGEVIEVKEKGATITANVPMDPAGAERPVGHLIWQLVWRRIQNVLSAVSILVAVGFAVWVPGIITIGLLVVQVAFYALFRHLAIPPKPKNWGIIYDDYTRLPLTQAVARIFDKQYNKLLETQVTDKSGRYAFLVGRNEYYVTYEKGGYDKKQSMPIDLKNNPDPAASVGVDTGLKPSGLDFELSGDKKEIT
ncbi:MAG: fibronectin type III domain-containing protein, partial [Patescibacteria group bacterium]